LSNAFVTLWLIKLLTNSGDEVELKVIRIKTNTPYGVFSICFRIKNQIVLRIIIPSTEFGKH
jgi:hypothetical protein